jgi:hypothetical protein
MARRRKRIATATDPVVLGCLERIRRGEVTAAGVLADFMDENGLPYASRVRGIWDDYRRQHNYWATLPDSEFERTWYTRWEATAWTRRRVRMLIGRLFGRKWKKLPLQKFQ